jgi:hypothetical protein
MNIGLTSCYCFNLLSFSRLKVSKMSDESASGHSNIWSNSVPNQVSMPVPSIVVNSDHLTGNNSARKKQERNLDESPLHSRVVGDDGVSVLIHCCY